MSIQLLTNDPKTYLVTYKNSPIRVKTDYLTGRILMAGKHMFSDRESQEKMLTMFIETCRHGEYTECMYISDDLFRSVGENPGEITEFVMYLNERKLKTHISFRSCPQQSWLNIDGEVIYQYYQSIEKSIKNIPKNVLMNNKVRLMPLILAFKNGLVLQDNDMLIIDNENTCKIQSGVTVNNIRYDGAWTRREVDAPTPESTTIPSAEMMHQKTIDLFRTEKLEPLFQNKEMVRKGCVKIDITDEPLYVLYWVENTYKTLGYRYSYDPTGKILSITW